MVQTLESEDVLGALNNIQLASSASNCSSTASTWLGYRSSMRQGNLIVDRGDSGRSERDQIVGVAKENGQGARKVTNLPQAAAQ
ncbi:hypothetical protein EON65_54620 [archaeon]|nr:MAG: hypothetical protein EON65_54620 [archaeon]